jgi:hypothetical protein
LVNKTYILGREAFCASICPLQEVKEMTKRIIATLGMIVALGLISTVYANEPTVKFPKNKGAISVQTSPQSYPVLIDGVEVGTSGIDQGNTFFVDPGVHKIEIKVPNATPYTKEINVGKYVRECVCIKVLDKSTTRNCPYNVSLDAPKAVKEGDLVTFAAFNAVTGSPTLNYVWKVLPENAKITSGIGTNSITIDTTGLAGQTISAELDVTDGVFDASCRQRTFANTLVEKLPEPEKKVAYQIDTARKVTNFDDDKARLDIFAVELQNNPDAQGYIVVYQGIEKRAKNADKIVNRASDYMVKSRGVDPRRVSGANGGYRESTQMELWIIPAGANPPTPTPTVSNPGSIRNN